MKLVNHVRVAVGQTRQLAPSCLEMPLPPLGRRGAPFFGKLLVIWFPLAREASAAHEPEMHPLSSDERVTAAAATVLQGALATRIDLRRSSLDPGCPDVLRVADSSRSPDPAGPLVFRFPQVAGAPQGEEFFGV